MGKWDSDDEDEAETKKPLPSKKQKVQAAPHSKPEPQVVLPPQQIVVSEPVRAYNPLLQGCRSVECYQRLSFIDQGTYGMVFRAKDIETNVVYALKQVKLGPETGKMGFPITALREINILMTLSHPNIVKVKEMVVGDTIDKIFMVMEYCENDLKKCMQTSKQSFSIAEIKQLMLQLLSAVNYMHSLWFIHRDLKSSNLLYSNTGVLCVCDFGLARRFSDPVSKYTFEVVTLWYRAPELLLGQTLYSIPIDMWSVGCIFAEMFLGDPLFPGEGEIDTMSKIFTALGMPSEGSWPGVTSLPNWKQVSSRRFPVGGNLAKKFPTTASFSGGLMLDATGYDLLKRFLTLDPAQRITAADALRHRWFSEAPLPTPADRMPTFKSAH